VFEVVHYKDSEQTMGASKKQKPWWYRILAALFNAWLWDLLFKRVLYWLFPSWDKTIKIGTAPLDATLVSLDGKTMMSLLHDIVLKTPRDMPLILNMGSYN
jgi:hypothetical protein